MKITVKGRDKTFSIPGREGLSLLDILIENRLEKPETPCGGKGKCGKCKILVTGDETLTDIENDLLDPQEIESGYRLACLYYPTKDITIELKNESSQMQIKTDGLANFPDYCSLVASCDITLEKNTIEKAVSLDQQLKEELYKRNIQAKLPHVLYSQLNALNDKTATKISYIDNQTITGFTSAKIGVAVDIGTTTVAVYFLNLLDYTQLDVISFRNPLSIYGADVITRIEKVISDLSMLSKMQAILIESINKSIAQFCNTNNTQAKEIQILVFTGNTTMLHFATGLNPSGIANAPFQAQSYFDEYYTAQELGVNAADGALVYFPPCISSYVGADITCGIALTITEDFPENTLFIDVGTNGEMGLSYDNKFLFCSTAAGPAFEGANIKCGMPGIDGAIHSVFFNEEGKISYATIADKKPCGICGSGLIDAVAILLENGDLDETGYLEEKFMLSEAENVYLDGKDIREIQLAKTAICAGIHTLLHEAKLSLKEVDRLVLAGGFGSYIKPQSACRIGLLPQELEHKIVFGGNTAGMGAIGYLFSKTIRERIRDIPKRSRYIELSQNSVFSNEFMNRMFFE